MTNSSDSTGLDRFSPEADRIIAEATEAAHQWRAQAKAIEDARDTQPQRLAKARADAEVARDWSQIEEPFAENVTALRGHTNIGEPTANTIALPNMEAKVIYGARLAFDMLDAGDDADALDAVKSRYFTMVGGDPGLAMLLASDALDTIASLIVPQMLDDLERYGGNYDARVLLAEARAKAWRERVRNQRPAQDDECGGAR